MLRICQTTVSGGEKMRTVQYPATLNTKVDTKTREVIERVATQNKTSIGEVTRDLLNEGMRARGIA